MAVAARLRNMSPPVRKALPALLVIAYWLCLSRLGAISPGQWFVGAMLLALSYGGAAALRARGFLLPGLLTAVVYDSQRYYSDLIRGPVHVVEPYLFDKTYFGIHTAQGILTPNEWWQLHTLPALDAVTGFFYLFFIPLFVATAVYFRLRGRIGRRLGMELDLYARRANGIMWAFFWVNVIGYSTYYWYAAAPPWYVSLYGLGPARAGVPPNPAGCIRFDHLLGMRVFSGFYGLSCDTYGAEPSLHVAYPLIAVIYAFKLDSARAWSLVFFAAMCFSAVYLNHHYVLDILWGSAYAAVITPAVDAYFNRSPALLATPALEPAPRTLPLESQPHDR